MEQHEAGGASDDPEMLDPVTGRAERFSAQQRAASARPAVSFFPPPVCYPYLYWIK